MSETTKNHWEEVYKTKEPNQVSWTQDVPKISLDIILSVNLSKKAKIIDIGGVDSKLVDFLLAEGYEDITVLDISENAIKKAQKRLGDNAKKVTWIVSDVTAFKPKVTYDLWHDRATFHFLTNQEQVEEYLDIVRKWVSGYLVLGTFSENGPAKCSGLTVKQYTPEKLSKEFETDFVKISCCNEDHITPFETTQNFLFCSFKKK